MRIRCESLRDFVSNLEGVEVYRSRIFVQKALRSLTEQPEHKSHANEVSLQFTAVLDYADGGQALLQGEQYCGVDRTTGDGGLEGSRKAERLTAELKAYCQQRDLEVLPGRLDLM